MDQQCRHDIPHKLVRLQIFDSHPLPPPIRRKQDIPLLHLGNDGLRSWIPMGEPHDTNLRLLAASEILEPGYSRPLHQLHKGRSSIWIHECRVGSPHLHSTTPDRVAFEAFAEAEGRRLDHIPERCNVCGSSSYVAHILLISTYSTCIVAVVRYVYIVKQNKANAEYFVWRYFPLWIRRWSWNMSLMPAIQHPRDKHRCHGQLHASAPPLFRTSHPENRYPQPEPKPPDNTVSLSSEKLG